VKGLLAELEVPFSPDQVQWRVTNTTYDKNPARLFRTPIRGPIPID